MVNRASLVDDIKVNLDNKFPAVNLKLLPPIYIDEVLATLTELGYEIIKKDTYLDTAKLYFDLQSAIESGISGDDENHLHIDILQILQSLSNSNWRLVQM